MNKLKKIVNSVVQYFILLILIYVIQYIIEHFWQMPDYLDLLFNFIVGIHAILITISEEKMKQLKMIPILRVHFESMNEVNEKIAQGAKDGTFKGSLRFLGGISYMILYS